MGQRVHCGLSVAALLCAIGFPAFGQEGTPAPGETEKAEGGDIVVTGSLIRRLPREYIASPVLSYGLEDVEKAGSGSLSEYMLTIPQNFTGDLSDFGTSAASIGTTLGDGTTYNQYDGFAGFALRGLASDATLTLINGRRMATIGMIEAPTVSVIPSALIERIDVIPDGASATYGADAVAGVVNIVTRKVTDGAELRLRASTATRTGSNNAELSALAGHSWGSGNVYGAAMYQKRSAYIEDPITVSNTPLQITQLPEEELSGLYAGFEQELGNVTLSANASHFLRNRSARINYIDHDEDNRTYRNRASGLSAYGNVHWQASKVTSFDLNIDWGSNRTESQLFYGPKPERASRSYTHRNTLFAAELTGQTELAGLPAGPILLAGGAQYRRETLNTTAKIFFNLKGGEREVKSVFGEAYVPIVSAEMGVPLIRSLTLSAAARYEDLGFDNALAPKVGVRWQIDRSIALRGTYARSFMVPRFRDTIGIAEQVSFWNYPYAFLKPGEQNPALPAGNAVVMYRSGANPDLRTQKADTFTVGVDLTPVFVTDLSIKFGYYRVKISGRIVTPSQDDSVTVLDLQRFNRVNPSAAMVNNVVNNPTTFRWFTVGIPFVNNGEDAIYGSAKDIPASLLSQVQVIADIRPQNFAVETTDGFDLDLSYRTRLFGGTARFQLTGQYILNLSLAAGEGGAAASRLNGYAQPADLRLNGSAAWARGGVSIGSVVNHVGGFTDNRPGMTPRKVGSFTTASLFMGLDLGRLLAAPEARGSELQLVVANVFDRRPHDLVDAVLGFDPYNNPPNPRTISVVFTKRFGRS